MVEVIQATAWYPPYNSGGTESYVEGLVGALRARGIETNVLVPRHRKAPESYDHAGAKVYTYPVNESPIPGELHRRKPHQGFESFRALLAKNRNAVYHQQSWSRGCGLHHLQTAHKLGRRTVLTVHVPGNFCLRGTMMRFGATVCDGRVEEIACAACVAQARGLPRLMAAGLARLPCWMSLSARRLEARLATAVSLRARVAEQRDEMRTAFESADRIVAVCDWLYHSLLANGAPHEKLVLSRQGLAPDLIAKLRTVEAAQTPGAPLRLLFLGRWDPVKGIDVLVRAVRALPKALSVKLTVHAIATNQEGRKYEAQVRALAKNDPRIAFAGPVHRDALASVFASHDVLAVPSTWLETGPLVVLEAQAAGLFVLGSRRGGIEEIIDENDGGVLVAAGDVAAWSEAIAAIERRHSKGTLPHPSRSVRSIETAAEEMAHLYKELAV